MRSTIWEFTGASYPCLIDVARDIAAGQDPHQSQPGNPLSALTDKTCPQRVGPIPNCPMPINYLANGMDSNVLPADVMGLAGRIPGGPYPIPPGQSTYRWTPCDFAALDILV